MDWKAVVWLVMLVVGMAGCGGGQESALPPLLGHYRSPEGLEFLFQEDGAFQTPQRVSGRFTVDGPHVVLSVGTRSMTAERLSADEMFLPAQHGSVETHLFRVGSALAQSARAAAPAKPPSPAPAASPAAPPVDRSIPLERYAQLDLNDPMTPKFLLAAFQQPPLSDEQKLSLLSDAGSTTADAFARRDLMTKELSAIDARLSTTRAARYVRIEAADYVYLERMRSQAPSLATWNRMTSTLGHYDLERGFPIDCAEDGSVSIPGLMISFHPTPFVPSRQCFLPVEDETVARALEAEVSRSSTLPVSASLYFALDGPAPRIGPEVLAATLVHLKLRIFPPGLRPGQDQPLATFDIDVPQPLVR